MKPLTASLKVKVTSDVSPTCSALSATTMVAVGRWRVDRVVVGVGGAGAGIARRVDHTGIVQRDDVGGVGDVGRRGEGRRPGDAAVAERHRRQRAVGDRQVGIGEARSPLR